MAERWAARGVMNQLGARLRVAILVVVVSATLLIADGAILQGGTSVSRDSWTRAETVTPAAFAGELESRGIRKVQTVCVGFRFIYHSAHIPGAIYLGPGREPAGIS